MKALGAPRRAVPPAWWREKHAVTVAERGATQPASVALRAEARRGKPLPWQPHLKSPTGRAVPA